MYVQKTLWDTDSVISSQGSQDGASPCDSQESKTSSAGQEAAPASPSVKQEPGRELQTSDTSGLKCSDSSVPADHPSSSASRSLRQVSLALCQKLGSNLKKRLKSGSMEYVQAWKERVTPLGLVLSAHTAQARRPSGSDSTGSESLPAKESDQSASLQDHQAAEEVHGWVSPTATDSVKRGEVQPRPGMVGLAEMAQMAGWPAPLSNHANGSAEAFLERKRKSVEQGSKMGIVLSDLNMVVQMVAGYPTPRANDGTGDKQPPNREVGSSLKQVAGWVSPTVCSPNSQRGSGQDAILRKEKGHTVNLQDQATLVNGWAYPTTRDWKDTPGMAFKSVNPDGSERDRNDLLPRQVFGITSNLPGAGTENIEESRKAQLNPYFSAWLMGFPRDWVNSAIRAMATRLRGVKSRKGRQSSKG